MTLPFTTGSVTPNAPFKQNLPLATPTPNQFGASTPQEQQFMNAAMQNSDIAGIIGSLGSGAWDKIKGILPKNADGSVDWGAVGGDVVGFIKNNASTIVAGLSAVNGYERQQQSDAYAKQGLQLATDSYASKAGLRTSGVAGMLDPSAGTPDLSNLQRLAGPNSGNPFAKALPMAPLNNHPAPTPPSGALPLAPPPGTPPVIGGTEPPLTGLSGLPNGGPPLLPNGGQSGPGPTIPVGMKPPPGWTPPKAQPLPLAQTPTLDPNNPNAPKLPYAS